MTDKVPEPGLDPELDWTGWGEDDWDDEKVRADLWDLLRQLAVADGAGPELVERRLAGVRRWAARESARGRAHPGSWAAWGSNPEPTD